jgi:hypothetical protein
MVCFKKATYFSFYNRLGILGEIEELIHVGRVGVDG